MALGTLIGGYGQEIHLNFDLGLIFRNFIIYSTRVFLPPMPNSDFNFWIFTACGLGGIYLICFASCYFRGYPYRNILKILLFCVAGFIILLIPVNNLGVSTGDTQGERFLYLPSVFASIYISFMIIFTVANRRAILILSTLIILFFGACCSYLNRNRVSASKIARNILIDLEKLKGASRIFILNLPDNFNGAYVYRNGFYPAIQYFMPSIKGGINPNKVRIISRHNVFKENDEIALTKVGLGDYHFKLLNPEASFVGQRIPVGGVLSNTEYAISGIKNNEYRIMFKDLKPNDAKVFYSQGSLVNCDSF